MSSGFQPITIFTKSFILDIRLDSECASVEIHLFKVNNRNTRKRCKIRSKLTIKTPEHRLWRCSGVFIVSFEHISHLFLVFLLLIEQVNVRWVYSLLSFLADNLITGVNRLFSITLQWLLQVNPYSQNNYS